MTPACILVLAPLRLLTLKSAGPLGLVDHHEDIHVNRLVTIREGSATINAKPLVPASLRRSSPL
jgi:hypothetical protein